MKKLIATLALVVTMFGGLALVAPSANAATTWDCDTTGVTQCSGTLGGIGDAWESFDYQDPAPFYDDTHVLYYNKTYTNVYPMVGPNSIVIKSVNIPHTWHVFSYRK